MGMLVGNKCDITDERVIQERQGKSMSQSGLSLRLPRVRLVRLFSTKLRQRRTRTLLRSSRTWSRTWMPLVQEVDQNQRRQQQRRMTARVSAQMRKGMHPQQRMKEARAAAASAQSSRSVTQ